MCRIALILAIVSATPAIAQVVAITDVNVIDVGTGSVHPAMTVVISGDRIAQVRDAASGPAPDGARVVDGRDRYLIPGLWDMHVHTSTDPITREVLFPLFVAHGITGIRSMAADCFEGGPTGCDDPALSDPLPSIREVENWRREIKAGTLAGPRIVAGSANLHGPRPGEESTPENPGTAEDARAHVRLLRQREVDFIKVYSGFPRDAYFALADEASMAGLPLAGHVPISVRASEASMAGQKSIEHIGPGNELVECSTREPEIRPRLLAELTKEGGYILPVLEEIASTYDAAACSRVFRTFVENGTWVTPTLVLARLPGEIDTPWQSDSRRRFLAGDELAYWSEWGEVFISLLGTPEEQAGYSAWIRRVFGSMHEAGVRFLAGTDAGYPGVFWGSTLHEELQLLVSAGLTNREALQAATSGPAEFLGLAGNLGSVEEGKLADLVLLEANPLADIANTERIVAVFLGGRLFDRNALDALLRNAEEFARSQHTRPSIS